MYIPFEGRRFDMLAVTNVVMLWILINMYQYFETFASISR